jgi:hypothetical protein
MLRNRHHTVTRKIKTNFGSMYIHVDLDDAGRPVGGQISTPGKEPESQIAQLVFALSEGLNDACSMVTYDGKIDGQRGYFEACRLIREQGLRDGTLEPVNDRERRIAEGRDE